MYIIDSNDIPALEERIKDALSSILGEDFKIESSNWDDIKITSSRWNNETKSVEDLQQHRVSSIFIEATREVLIPDGELIQFKVSD